MDFEIWWNESLDRLFVGEERSQWLPIIKQISELAFMAGSKVSLQSRDETTKLNTSLVVQESL